MSARPGKGRAARRLAIVALAAWFALSFAASKAAKPRREPRWVADESLRARLVLDAKQRIEDARRGGLTT